MPGRWVLSACACEQSMRWQRHVALLCCRLAALHGFAVQQMAPTGRQPAINRVPTIGFWKVTKEIKDSWVSLGCLGNCEISCAKVAQRDTSRDGLRCSCPCSISGRSCLCTATIGPSEGHKIPSQGRWEDALLGAPALHRLLGQFFIRTRFGAFAWEPRLLPRHRCCSEQPLCST